MKKHLQIVIVLSFFAVVSGVEAKAIRWNVLSKFGISSQGISKAIHKAKIHFRNNPDDVVILEFDEGSFYLDGKSAGKGIINLSGIKPGENGRLIFQGKGMDKTIFVFADNKPALYGNHVCRVTFADMHMTRKNYTVSQGLVVDVTPGKVILDITPGFPSLDMIYNPGSRQGRYLRRYTNSSTNPQLILKENRQIAWKSFNHIEGQRWQLNLNHKNQVANYSKGDLIGIKSKHGGQAYWFYSGSDFVFKSVKWTHKSRGVFRGGFEKVQFLDCVIDRAPPINGQMPCLATPGGGPQIGQPKDPATSGHLVKNCRIIAVGDDAVAFFNATGKITDCYIKDPFARAIMLFKSSETVLENNTIVRGEVQR